MKAAVSDSESLTNRHWNASFRTKNHIVLIISAHCNVNLLLLNCVILTYRIPQINNLNCNCTCTNTKRSDSQVKLTFKLSWPKLFNCSVLLLFRVFLLNVIQLTLVEHTHLHYINNWFVFVTSINVYHICSYINCLEFKKFRILKCRTTIGILVRKLK